MRKVVSGTASGVKPDFHHKPDFQTRPVEERVTNDRHQNYWPASWPALCIQLGKAGGGGEGEGVSKDRGKKAGGKRQREFNNCALRLVDSWLALLNLISCRWLSFCFAASQASSCLMLSHRSSHWWSGHCDIVVWVVTAILLAECPLSVLPAGGPLHSLERCPICPHLKLWSHWSPLLCSWHPRHPHFLSQGCAEQKVFMTFLISPISFLSCLTTSWSSESFLSMTCWVFKAFTCVCVDCSLPPTAWPILSWLCCSFAGTSMTLVFLTWAFLLNICCLSQSRLAALFIAVIRSSSVIVGSSRPVLSYYLMWSFDNPVPREHRNLLCMRLGLCDSSQSGPRAAATQKLKEEDCCVKFREEVRKYR